MSKNNESDYDFDIKEEIFSEEEEDLPLAELNNKDNFRVIKAFALLFIFFSVLMYSILFNNSPETNKNIVFEEDNMY